MGRNPNRGVVLRLSDAAVLYRWLELLVDGRTFDNPIVAMETLREARAARVRLGQKLVDIFQAHEEPESDDAVGQRRDFPTCPRA